jgi:hypothetical protein
MTILDDEVRKITGYAITIVKVKIGVSLDFSIYSLESLDELLQKAFIHIMIT